MKGQRLEDDTHSFVVRVWPEAVDREGQLTGWRGYVDDIASGQRFHFQDLQEIARFIARQIGLKAKSMSRWQALLAKIKRAAQ